MTVTYDKSFIHNIVNSTDGIIYLPVNPSICNTNKPDLTAFDSNQRYDLTTKYRYNGKTFVYVRGVVQGTGGTYVNAKLIASKGVCGTRSIAISYSTSILQSHPAGSEYVDVTLASVSENDYKYGHLIIGHSGDTAVQNRSIIANSATGDFNSGQVRFYLDVPLWVATTVGTTSIEGWKCPYGSVEWPGSDYQYASTLGIPMISCAQGALNGQYFWIQTWGPCWVCPGAAALGASANERQAFFDAQGQLAVPAAAANLQIAGFLLEKTQDTYESISAYDGEFIMLTIDP